MLEENTYYKPATLSEAFSLAKSNKEIFRFMAGGTDFLVNKFQGTESARCIIDLTGIAELKNIKTEDGYLKIGSLIRLDELKNIPEIKNEFPVLLEAVQSIATPVIRKTATLGGNILCENRCTFFNQSEWWREAVGYCLKCDGDICIATGGKKACFSKFVSDTAPILISMNALIETIEGENVSIKPLESIYSGDGTKPRNLSKNTIVKSIHLPLHQQFRCTFTKLRQRESMDFTSLSFATSITKSGKIKIVVGGVDSKPIVIDGTEDDNKNELINQAVKKSKIVDNDFFSRNYRKEMIKVFGENSFK